ncbi:nitrous-oxide reductase [Effusibacillus lacus]|uniref:Nitrous-oxide reductase n=2 Tax=Effusibacillus lacus TaxID=1348429 RepID=A0A292YI75_9BACL|nr:nitrous-oxide reductase [Effusibacillus lacus]
MKKIFTVLFGSLFLTSVLVAGCGREEAKPVAIAAGVDKCDVCNMLVPDDHNATETILKNGKVLKFDDIGCQNAWSTKNGKDQIQARFVRDFNSKEWIKLENATFAYDKDFKTAMAYGVLSFKDKAAAQKYIDEQKKGKLLTPADLETHSWERNMEMMKQMKQQPNMQQNAH